MIIEYTATLGNIQVLYYLKINLEKIIRMNLWLIMRKYRENWLRDWIKYIVKMMINMNILERVYIFSAILNKLVIFLEYIWMKEKLDWIIIRNWFIMVNLNGTVWMIWIRNNGLCKVNIISITTITKWKSSNFIND